MCRWLVEEAELRGQQRDRREGDPLSDPDDRVESDIIAARLVTEPRDDFPDNDTGAAQPVRHYRHSPNRDLNTLLTAVALTAIGFALGIAIGHSFGKLAGFQFSWWAAYMDVSP